MEQKKSKFGIVGLLITILVLIGAAYGVFLFVNNKNTDTEDNTIDLCKGCKYFYEPNKEMWTTWNTKGETATVITSGLSDNYLDAIDENNRKYFLGVVLNSSNQVTNAYICGVKNDTPFCIEATNDKSSYKKYKEFFQGENLWNGACEVENKGIVDTVLFEETYCPSNDSIFADVSDDGNNMIGINGNRYCFVDINGSFACNESE